MDIITINFDFLKCVWEWRRFFFKNIWCTFNIRPYYTCNKKPLNLLCWRNTASAGTYFFLFQHSQCDDENIGRLRDTSDLLNAEKIYFPPSKTELVYRQTYLYWYMYSSPSALQAKHKIDMQEINNSIKSNDSKPQMSKCFVNRTFSNAMMAIIRL